MNRCTFCDTEIESYMHLFVQCKYVQQLWSFGDKLTSKPLNGYEILSNNIEQNPTRVENCIILFIKYYIYRTRCLQE